MLKLLLYIGVFSILIYSQEEWRAPDPPTSIKTKATTNTITLWWEPPESYNQFLVRGYTISYGIGTPSRKIVLEGLHINSFTIENLKPNTTYVIVMTAYNEADEEDSDKVFLTETTDVENKIDNDMIYNYLKVPQITDVIPLKNGIIELKWDDTNNINSMKNYFIRYNIYGNDDEEEVITINKNILIDNLEPGTKYEFKVKVKDSDGNESDFSEKKSVVTLDKIISIDTESFECNFEKGNECKFVTDGECPLKWKNINSKEPDSYYPSPRFGDISQDSFHYMILEASSDPYDTFGRLSSPYYQLIHDNNFCLTLWIYVTPSSHGSFTIFMKSYESKEHDIIYKERFEKMLISHWSKLSLDIKKSHSIFKIIVEGQKSVTSEKFMIAIDDFSIISGHCENTWNGDTNIINDKSMFYF
ncbi:MIP20649p [Strongyloides ratti]|uniref:MIP20649p n=1 Tax=Strongyloides ratti TaxID=34506 RepID=A0A090L8I7_STRRB|nr:MIP20649p [Strongyloides ratti]CEF66091.1 MIP20649p [Strongyloides ratti]